MSVWTGHDNSRHFHLDNGYKQVTLVTQEVPAEELNKMISKEYVTWKSICHSQRSDQESVRTRDIMEKGPSHIQVVNGNLNEDICSAQIYFVENILSSNIKEIQSA